MRKALFWVGLPLVVLLLLVAVAPTLVNWGLGQGAIRRLARPYVNGEVTLHRLGLGWFGSQSVDAEVAGDAGATTARVDVQLNAGLLSLLTGRISELQVDLSGTMKGELRESGATSLGDLLATRAPEKRKPKASDAGTATGGLPWNRPATVRVSKLDVELREAGSGRVIGVHGLTGTLTSLPGERVTFDLAGGMTGFEKPGSLKINGDVAKLFDTNGDLTLDRAAGRIAVNVNGVRVPLTERPTEIRALTLTANSAGLTERLDLTLEIDAVIEGSESGRLAGQLSVDRPVEKGRLVSVGDLAYRTTGQITGRSVPTALLQETLRRTPVVAVRDLGPTLDIEARFSDGQQRNVTINARAESMELAAAGTVDPQGAVALQEMRFSGLVKPALALAAVGATIDQAARVTLDLDSLTLPAGDGTAAQLRRLAAAGTVTMRTPIVVDVGAETALPIADVEARFETPNLGERGATVGGTALVDGAATTFDLSLDGWFDAGGALTPAGVRPQGNVTVRGLQPARLAALMPAQASLIEAAVVEPVGLAANVASRNGDMELTVDATSGVTQVNLVGRRGKGSFRVMEARGRINTTPALVAALQEGSQRPLVLVRPTPVTFQLEPFDVVLPADGGGARIGEVRGRLATDEAVVRNIPRVSEPIAVGELGVAIAARLGDTPATYSMDGQGRLRTVDGGGLADARCALTAARGPEGTRLGELNVELSNLSVSRLDAVTGRDAGSTLTDWIGDRGTVRVALTSPATGFRATVGADFSPSFVGEFVAESDGDTVSVTAREPKLLLRRDVLQKRLNPATGKQAGQTPAALITVAADVPMVLKVNRLRFPQRLLHGEPFDGAAVNVDLALNGGPLVLEDPRTGRNTIDQLAVSLTTGNLDQGAAVNMTGRVSFAGAVAPGRIELTGQMTGLMREGLFDARQAELEMTANIDGLHTAVVDAAANLKGLLVAAVGTPVKAQAVADQFSRNTGSLQATVDTPNGHLEFVAAGRDNGLAIDAERPVHARLEITPPMRERLLRGIHPLLADIRTTEQPLQATVRNAFVPLDGDVSRLQADIDITIGAVELDSGSLTLTLLAVGKTTNARTIPGYIEPIKALIRDGIVTYERFAARIDKYTLVYSGRINLKTRQVYLLTEIPLEGLAGTFKELQGYAEDLAVPLVTRGTLDKHKTEIEPEFLAEAAAKAGLRQLFKGADKEIGDLFDGLIKKKK